MIRGIFVRIVLHIVMSECKYRFERWNPEKSAKANIQIHRNHDAGRNRNRIITSNDHCHSLSLNRNFRHLQLNIPALSKELSQAKAPPLQELIFNFFVPSETGHFGSLCPLETLHRIRFTELDKTLSQLQHPFPNLHTVSFTCEEPIPTSRNLDCPQLLRNDDSACRIPLPKPYRDALCFEEMTSTFLEMAFPLTLAQGSVTMKVIDTSQDATPNALF